MNIFFMCIFIAVSLSMDAFSLALIYGTYGLSLRNEIILSIIVGTFHLIMPLLGLFFGSVLMKYFIFNINLVVGIIFGIIGLEMFFSGGKEDDVKLLVGWIGFLLFGLSVSVDSFTTGIGLSAISNNFLCVSIIFMLVSGMFTFLGLILGDCLNEKFGKYATIVGGIMMIFLGIYYIFKV